MNESQWFVQNLVVVFVSGVSSGLFFSLGEKKTAFDLTQDFDFTVKPNHL